MEVEKVLVNFMEVEKALVEGIDAFNAAYINTWECTDTALYRAAVDTYVRSCSGKSPNMPALIPKYHDLVDSIAYAFHRSHNPGKGDKALELALKVVYVTRRGLQEPIPNESLNAPVELASSQVDCKCGVQTPPTCCSDEIIPRENNRFLNSPVTRDMFQSLRCHEFVTDNVISFFMTLFNLVFPMYRFYDSTKLTAVRNTHFLAFAEYAIPTDSPNERDLHLAADFFCARLEETDLATRGEIHSFVRDAEHMRAEAATAHRYFFPLNTQSGDHWVLIVADKQTGWIIVYDSNTTSTNSSTSSYAADAEVVRAYMRLAFPDLDWTLHNVPQHVTQVENECGAATILTAYAIARAGCSPLWIQPTSQDQRSVAYVNIPESRQILAQRLLLFDKRRIIPAIYY